MPTTTPTLPLERELAQQICQALQGSVAETILKTAKDGSGDEYWSSRMEGHSMKVDKEISAKSAASRMPKGTACFPVM